MAIDVKIVRFQLTKNDFTRMGEKELVTLRNQGYAIVAYGGTDSHAYVVLEKSDRPKRPPTA